MDEVMTEDEAAEDGLTDEGRKEGLDDEGLTEAREECLID